jgi:uncharacterized coiled-coil protein SlyX
VHEAAGPVGSATGLIYKKWVDSWTPQQIGQMMERVWSHPELEVRLTQAAQFQTETAARMKTTEIRLESDRGVISNLAQTSLQQQQHIGLLSRKVDDLEKNLTQQALKYAALLGSRSWRMTLPLRWLANITRKSPVGGTIRKARAWFK